MNKFRKGQQVYTQKGEVAYIKRIRNSDPKQTHYDIGIADVMIRTFVAEDELKLYGEE